MQERKLLPRGHGRLLPLCAGTKPDALRFDYALQPPECNQFILTSATSWPEFGSSGDLEIRLADKYNSSTGNAVQ